MSWSWARWLLLLHVQVYIILGALPTCLSFLLVSDIHGLSLLHNCIHLVADFISRVLFGSVENYMLRRVVAIVSFFFLVIIFPSNSSRMSAQMSISFLSTSESHFARVFLHLVTIIRLFLRTQLKGHFRLPSPSLSLAIIVTATVWSWYETCSVSMVWLTKRDCFVTVTVNSAVVWPPPYWYTFSVQRNLPRTW